MAYQVGYWTDLSEITAAQMTESENMVSTFQAMPYGKYTHPVYGEIELNEAKAREAADNVNKRVRGQDLDIDYDHKQFGGEAAGWVKGAEARSDGLYLTVEWTKRAWQAIKEKAYRYFSPEFTDEWTHPKTKTTYKNVLFGGGITNRPFLKDILPLNMSELFAEERDEKKGTGMDPKRLRKLLGLPEDATDEAVNAKLGELPEDFVIELPKEPENEPPKGEGEDEGANENEQVPVVAGLSEEQVKQLSEGNPAIKALFEHIGTLTKKVETQGVALQLAEVDGAVRKLTEPVNGKALPAGTAKLLKDALLTPSQDGVIKLVEAIAKTGLVETGEKGEAGDHGEHDGAAATTELDKKVHKLMEDDKLSYGDAVERISLMEPDLFEAHRQASYAFREN
jgi:phage I-like protein